MAATTSQLQASTIDPSNAPAKRAPMWRGLGSFPAPFRGSAAPRWHGDPARLTTVLSMSTNRTGFGLPPRPSWAWVWREPGLGMPLVDWPDIGA